MENTINLTQNKAPAPNFEDESKQSVQAQKPKRKLNMPNVGVVDVPKISSMPLKDTINLKKKDNPKMAYKLSSPLKEKTNKIKTDLIMTSSVIALALIALIKEIRPIIKKIKK